VRLTWLYLRHGGITRLGAAGRTISNVLTDTGADLANVGQGYPRLTPRPVLGGDRGTIPSRSGRAEPARFLLRQMGIPRDSGSRDSSPFLFNDPPRRFEGARSAGG